MFRIDDPSAVASPPTPAAAGTEGYFSEGNPGAGTPATRVTSDFLNMLQEELRGVVVAGGLTPSKTDRTQLLAAIQALVKTLALGFNQTWQNLVASRAVATTYTNTTGRPIQVACGGVTSGASGGYSIQVNGVVVTQVSTVAGSSFSLQAIVPPGATYILTKGGSDTFSSLSWAELR